MLSSRSEIKLREVEEELQLLANANNPARSKEQKHGNKMYMIIIMLSGIVICIFVVWMLWHYEHSHATNPVSNFSSTCDRRDIYTGVNMIDSSQFYEHHHVFCEFPEFHAPVSPQMIQEFNGLKVPARFDCNNFNNGQPWGAHPYFDAVPDRWTKCRELESMILSNREFYVPQLPIIDEEYEEHVELYKNLLEAGKKYGSFHMVEAGARWGTWGFRATAAGRRIFGDEFQSNVLFYEPEKLFCKGIEEVAEMNKFQNYEVSCDVFTAEHFKNYAAQKSVINHFDVDIQGFETIFMDQDLYSVLLNKVCYMKIGTHSEKIHEDLKKFFMEKGWIVLRDAGFGAVKFNPSKWLRQTRDWYHIRKYNLYYTTHFGPIMNWDGDLLLKNPKL